MNPSAPLLAWVEQIVGADVVGCERLTGGITSNVHLVTTRDHAYVLRSWDDPMPEYARGAVPREEIDGRAPLDVAGLLPRVEALLEAALRRL